MIDFNKMGLTKKQLVDKYGDELTNLILKSRFFDHATVALNEDKNEVYYFIDINYALREINGEKVNYVD